MKTLPESIGAQLTAQELEGLAAFSSWEQGQIDKEQQEATLEEKVLNTQGMTHIAEIEFVSPINMERSTGLQQIAHNVKSVMRLYKGNVEGYYCIEWDVEELEIMEHIGIWTDGKRLVDYDGVMSFPPEAAKLLRSASIVVPRDFLT